MLHFRPVKPLLRLPILACAALGLAFSALAADPAAWTDLFNGKDLAGWKTGGGKGTNQWKWGKAALDAANPTHLKVDGAGAELISPNSGMNLTSEASYGDCQVSLDFMLAQESNSGIKMDLIYEIQMFDSYGKEKPDNHDSGAIYDETAPKVNAARKPGEWQTLFIDFRAPRFDPGGKKIENARFIRVLYNGLSVQNNVEVEGGTRAHMEIPEAARNPIMLQGDHGPVAYRHIYIRPLRPIIER